MSQFENTNMLAMIQDCKDLQLTKTEHYHFIRLSCHFSSAGSQIARYATIASWLGMDRRQAIRFIQKLESVGLLTIQHNQEFRGSYTHDFANTYTLNMTVIESVYEATRPIIAVPPAISTTHLRVVN